jgi:hypothetical protein
VLVFIDATHGMITLPVRRASRYRALYSHRPRPPPTDPEARTLQLVGSWSLYTADQQTLLASYFLSSAPITQGANGWYIKGANPNSYSGFSTYLQGTAVQAGYNTTTSQYYIIDLSAENGFVWEFDFASVVNHAISGCRYRYPYASSNKGACLSFVGL